MKKIRYNIILGSNSPRRKEILTAMGINFIVRSSNTDESYPNYLKEKEISEFLAVKKSKNLINTIKDDEMLITADTIVCNSDSVLNKPKNYNESIEMLTSLSGKTHKVISSVYVYTHKKQIIFSDETEVTFLDLDPDIITYYIEKYQPFDKAGSYGIQEWIGLVGIDNINGSFTNVVGLPSSKLFQTIRNF